MRFESTLLVQISTDKKVVIIGTEYWRFEFSEYHFTWLRILELDTFKYVFRKNLLITG